MNSLMIQITASTPPRPLNVGLDQLGCFGLDYLKTCPKHILGILIEESSMVQWLFLVPFSR